MILLKTSGFLDTALFKVNKQAYILTGNAKKNVPPTSTAICSAVPVTINQINTPHNPYVSLMPSSK
jgi:hypothetical protein